MDNIETLHHKKMVDAESVGFIFQADLCRYIQMIFGCGCPGQHRDFHHKKVVVAEVVGFGFEADVFESVPMIFRFNTDVFWLWLSWTTLRRFTQRRWLLQKPLVLDSKHTSSNQYRCWLVLFVIDNLEMFHHNKMVFAGTIGLWLEADLFKSVPTILGFGCHEQHSHVSQSYNGCWEVYHKNMVAAEKFDFGVQEDFFKSVPMFIGFGGRGEHWVVSP